MGLVHRIEGSEGGEWEDGEAGFRMVTTGSCRVDRLGICLSGGRERRFHGCMCIVRWL